MALAAVVVGLQQEAIVAVADVGASGVGADVLTHCRLHLLALVNVNAGNTVGLEFKPCGTATPLPNTHQGV